MLESLITTLDKFTPEILVILSGLLVITTTLFLWLWFANRRTYNLLRHQLPASVVKTYLDSVIQNSTSLKSALFRGGGNDISLPTSMPVIGGGENMAAAGPGDQGLRDQVQRLQSELSSLQSQLATANNVKKDLEAALAAANARIKELEALLAKAGTATGGGDNTAVVAEMQKVSKERDELREKLKEYEIIEDDLANLKRLQQENQQLKRSLGMSGGSAPAPVEEAPVSGGSDPLAGAADLFEEVPVAAEEDATAELEQFLAAGTEEPAVESEQETEKALNQSTPKAATSEKTPEDLLSEFEKMLG